MWRWLIGAHKYTAWRGMCDMKTKQKKKLSEQIYTPKTKSLADYLTFAASQLFLINTSYHVIYDSGVSFFLLLSFGENSLSVDFRLEIVWHYSTDKSFYKYYVENPFYKNDQGIFEIDQ